MMSMLFRFLVTTLINSFLPCIFDYMYIDMSCTKKKERNASIPFNLTMKLSYCLQVCVDFEKNVLCKKILYSYSKTKEVTLMMFEY